jgi:hypothetical protein
MTLKTGHYSTNVTKIPILIFKKEGRVEVNEIDLQEIFTKDVGDKHKRRA